MNMARIPGVLTSMLQPLDESNNKPVKDNVKNVYANQMSEGNFMFIYTEKSHSHQLKRHSSRSCDLGT